MSKDKDNFDFIEENTKGSEEDIDFPCYGSEGWEKYVMSQFTTEELYEGNYPTLNGMRRVAIVVFGSVVESYPTQVVSTLPHASYCIYRIVLENGRAYGAVADAHTDNISGPYSIYPSAIAESRAEARAYRKALLLSTVSAEEIKGNEKSFNSVLESVSDYNEDEPISTQQKKIIESKCKQLKINLIKFLKTEDVNFETAKKSDGIDLAKKLSGFQQKGVPEELK